MLSSGSDVFNTMFYGSMKEDGDIKIFGATAEAFKEFLRFFYFNNVDVSMEHVSDVMYIGRRYNVAECQRLCVNLLEANITEQNAIFGLGLAIIYEEKQLRKLCEFLIEARTDEVLKSENFLVCDQRVLEHILKMDYLACTEPELFEACMSWVRATSNEDHLNKDIVQTHLGRLFYKIRFGAMTLEEFGQLLPVYGELFSANEYSEIIQVFSGQERKPKIFKTEQRLLDWDHTKPIVCDRYKVNINVGFKDLKSETAIQFSSNTRLLLGYFVVAPVFTENHLPVHNIDNVEVAVIANSTKITQFTCALNYLDGEYRVDLPSPPISIIPENIYEIRIKFPTDGYQSPNLFSTSTVEMENNVVLVFHSFDGAHISIIKSFGLNHGRVK